MSTSIDQARNDVQSAFDRAFSCADNSRRRSMADFDEELWELVLALGRALVVLFLSHQSERWQKRVQYNHGGKRYEVGKVRTTPLGTRYGKVSFRRPTGQAKERRTGADLPVDRELGLCAGFALSVVTTLTKLCAQMAFANARATYKDMFGWMPSPRAVLRMVDAIGKEARPFLESAAPPRDDGEILVIQVDGGGAPMIATSEYRKRARPHKRESGLKRKIRRRRRQNNVRPRRTKGKKSKNSKMAFVGVIYALRRTPEGLDGPIAKRVYATFESHEALMLWLRHEADKRGARFKEVVFLADGSEHIWRWQQRYFPEAQVCVDWYHIVEYLWGAGECLHDEGTDELRKWVGRQAARLRRGANGAVLKELRGRLAEIPLTGPGNKGRRKRLKGTIKYLTNQMSRLNYASFRKQDLDIGTGAAEGTIKNLVRMRLDGCGMRWGRHRSELVLHLRCILLNGQWEEFTKRLAAKQDVTLAPKPVPAQTYDAKRNTRAA